MTASPCISSFTSFTPNYALLNEVTQDELQSKLRTNSYPFDPTEKLRLLDFISRLRDEVDKFDADIRKTRNKGARGYLREGRRVFEDRIHCSQSLISPIRKLSGDIMVQIFEFAIYPEIYITSRSARVPIFKLSRICKSWRDLTHSVASFWNQIVLVDPHRKQISFENTIKMSGSSTLAITFHHYPLLWAQSPCSGEILAILGRESPRLRALALVFGGLGPYRLGNNDIAPYRDMEGRLNSLEELALKWPVPQLTMFNNSPSLTKAAICLRKFVHNALDVEQPEAELSMCVPPIPWSQLETLKLANCCLCQLSFILPRCSDNLKCLALSLASCGNTVRRSPLAFPALQALYIGLSRPNTTIRLFQYLRYVTLPSLSNLTLWPGSDEDHRAETQADPQDFIEMIRCSNPPLSLSLGILSLLDPVQILEELPFLTSLTISEFITDPPDPMRRFIERLRHVELNGDDNMAPGTVFLPHLRRLTIYKSTLGWLNHDEIILALKSRFPPAQDQRRKPASKAVATLERVVLSFIDDWAEQDYTKYYRRIRKKGLNITIMSVPPSKPIEMEVGI